MGRSISEADFEGLYRATARDLLRHARRRGALDPEDVVAEAFAVAWRRRTDLPAPALRRAWLFGVVRTLLLADDRVRRRDAAVALPVVPGEGGGAAGDGAASAVVVAALGRLSLEQREVLQLTAWDGLTPAELAVALGITPGAARVRLHRARQALAADPAVAALVADGTSGELAGSRAGP